MTPALAPTGEVLHDILYAGVRAPTADNRPVVRLRLHADRIELWALPEVATPAQPHRRALGLLAAGAMVENMVLRAAARGFALHAEPLPDALLQPALLAVLHWRGAAALDAPDAALDAAIEHRHTNRRFYRRSPVPPAALQVVTRAGGGPLQWLEGPARRRALQAIRWAEAERFRRVGLHEELFGSIRFDVGWQADCDEGLPPVALEVEPPLRPGFALLRHWPVMRAARWLGAAPMLGVRAGWLPCAMAPQLGLMTLRRDAGEAGWLLAGRAFERVWLAAQAQGLALQPMAAAVALTLQRPGGAWVSPRLQQRLKAALQGLCDGALQPCMLFRLGQADTPSGVTRRGLLSHYIEAA